MNLKRKIRNSIHFLYDLMENQKKTDKKFKLLLIKDNEGDIRLIEEMLLNIKDVKFELNCVDHLSDGLFQLSKSNFDLILLDLELSDIQGLNNLLKLHSNVPDVPIIVLTCLTNENIARKAMIEGIQDFLIKDHVDSNLLLRSIFYAIERFKIIKKLKKERIALQELDEKFRQIIEQEFMAIAIFQENIFKCMNETFSKMLEFSILEIMNWTTEEFFERVHPEDRSLLMEQFRKLKLGQKDINSPHSFRIISQSGKIIYGDAYFKIIQYQGKNTILVTFIDITECKRVEAALQESKENYRNAYNHNEFYKDLLSHDIMNYLHNIGLTIEICDFYLDNPEELKKEFKIMQNQLNKAAKLISNVQKISKLEECEPILEPIKVDEVLKEAIKFAQENFERREINIQIDSPKEVLFVQADTFLVDVFENILYNAGKYNKDPLIEILIRISKVQRDGINYLQLEFIDNGVGIPDVRKEKIFQRINRGDPSVRGMGLGLSLVKKIITNYKGLVWVEDRVVGDYSKGSNFILLIPEAC